MSDDIFRLNNEDQIITVGQPAWHGKGITVPDGLNSLVDIRRAGVLCYDYAVSRLYDENAQELNGFRAITRVPCDVDGNPNPSDSTVVSVGVTDSYKLITLRRTIDTIQPLLDSGDLVIDAAGSLGIGDRTFVSCEIPAAATDLDGGIRSFLQLLLDYRGKAKNETRANDFRVVCANTWAAAMLDKSLADIFPAISHKGDIRWKLADAQRAIEAYVLAGEDRAREYRSLMSRELSDDELRAFFDSICPMPERPTNPTEKELRTYNRAFTTAQNRRAILKSSWTDPTSPEGKTAWRALQCVTHAVDHNGFDRIRSSKTRDAASAKLESATFGSGAQLKADVYRMLLQLVS